MRSIHAAAAFLGILAGSMMMSGCVSMLPAVRATKTPLFLATVAQDRDRILPLLAKDVNLEVRSAGKGRELILAILERRKADALSLVEGGADANAVIVKSESNLYNNQTALMLATWTEDLALVKALAAKGADLKNKTPYGLSALSLATKAPMFELLLDLGVPFDKDEQGAPLLANAASLGNAEMVRLLISRGVDVEKARSVFEKSNAMLQSAGNSDIVNDPRIQEIIRKNNSSIQLLERLSRPQAAPPATAAAGVTKAELAQMMREAAAETARRAPDAAAPAVVVYKSDVDAPAYKASENPDAYALVVGVEKYNTLPDARFAERDAKAMNAHLLAMGYPQRNIVLLTGSQATRTGLAKNLEAWLPNNVTERSTVLFYFSGHGAPDAKTSQAYLVPMDGDPQYLEETAYPIKRLYTKLAALKAKRVLVALDSCFSGAGGRSVLAAGTRPLVAKMDIGPAEGKIVSLSASSSDEITGAIEEQGHGLFTYQLLKALTETAGRGTVAEVYTSLKPRVQDEARRQNRAQTPQMFGKTIEAGLR